MPSITQINSTWLEPNACARAAALYQYLKISPSYALADKVRREGVNASQQAMLASELFAVSQKEASFASVKAGFAKTLKTYDVVGEVWNRPFDTWLIKDKGYRLFGYKEAPPKASLITSLEDGVTTHKNQVNVAAHYMQVTRVKHGNPPLHLVAVPAGIGVSKQIELLREMLSELEAQTPPFKTSKPFFSFDGKRFRLDPIQKYLTVLTLNALAPSRPLWQLAAIAELSKSIKFKDPWNEKANSQNEYQRAALTPLGYRALKRAKNIAEHASQGSFPSHGKVILPKYDLAEVAKRIDQQ